MHTPLVMKLWLAGFALVSALWPGAGSRAIQAPATRAERLQDRAEISLRVVTTQVQTIVPPTRDPKAWLQSAGLLQTEVEQIAADLLSQYAITYLRPAGNTPRKLQVTTRRPGTVVTAPSRAPANR